jgi:hypothetical protein
MDVPGDQSQIYFCQPEVCRGMYVVVACEEMRDGCEEQMRIERCIAAHSSERLMRMMMGVKKLIHRRKP